ncbi:hypothetical protein KRX52_09870 [Pseudomonas sp. MAP12]|uniref:Uncharacterized protein n=1 Tax=Geopseudomonas aromaticivorans TaxID=2849492 RepID=A0ABS6MWC4_9GAMM|nr:hypothetical protein [Pseudomonas aromaticivorans]MBV2133108.1 hypothetical protein [Pseudomonas aromaticivorans]
MLLQTYEAQNLLCNLSVKGATSQADTYAFRGDLVLEEGEIADDAGRRLPPTAVVKQAALLVKGNKLTMVSGIITELAQVPLFIERYRHDLAVDVHVLFYVENLSKALSTDLDGVGIILLPHADGGAAWNTLMGDLRLEKDDFKGQSAEDKVVTMADALATFKPKLDSLGFSECLTFVSTARREHRGPV